LSNNCQSKSTKLLSMKTRQSGKPYAKARAAYQDFLTLWKDADPNISILKQAKAAYAKLQ